MSPSGATYFYTAWIIGMVPSLAPGALTTVLYAIGVADPTALTQRLRQTLLYSAVSVVAAASLLIVAGTPLLGFFGAAYRTEGTPALRLIAIAALPLIIRSHYVALARILDRVRAATALLATTALVEVAAASVGAVTAGLPGLAAGWAAILCVEAAVMSPFLFRAARPRHEVAAG